jgi:hypothetical protein
MNDSGQAILTWHALAALIDPQVALGRERPLVQRLFYACGGPVDWFAERVWPQMIAWEAAVVGLAADPSAGAPSSLRSVLAAAAGAAEARTVAVSDSSNDCEDRLAAATRAALAAARHWGRIAEVRSTEGAAWNPKDESLRAWRSRHPGQHWLAISPAARGDDPWGRAAEKLVSAGIWRLHERAGRWLPLSDGWALLWPLAGRDLLRRLAEEGGGQLQLEDVLSGLAEWSYLGTSLRESPIRSLLRDDGRSVLALPVSANLLRRAGLAATGSACHA